MSREIISQTATDGVINTTTQTTRVYEVAQSVAVEAIDNGFSLSIRDAAFGRGVQIDLTRAQLLALSDRCRALAGPGDPDLAALSDQEVAFLVGDDSPYQLECAEGNLIRWKLSPEDREALLERYFGAAVLRLYRADGAPRYQPAAPAEPAAPQADPGRSDG